MPRTIEKHKGKVAFKSEGKMVFKRKEDFILVSPEKVKRKPGRPRKHPVKEPAPEIKKEDLCSSCGKPLVFDEWNTAGTIGYCDNPFCTEKFHQPQGWRKSDKILNLEKQTQEDIYA